jgi:hypothetical protein
MGSAIGLLEKATITSLADTVMPAVRSGRLDDAMRSLGYSITEAFRTSAKGAIERREFAEDLGIVTAAFNDTILASRWGGGDPSTRLQGKVLDKYFRRTGLEHLTRGTRVAAAQIGRVFIRRLARDIQKGRAAASATRFLAELGVPESKAKDFAKWVSSFEGGMPEARQLDAGELSSAYRTAIARFVDQSIMRPSASTKPRWASHPLGSVVFQLQSFLYAFQKNVINRSLNLAKDAVTQRGLTLADRGRLLMPLAMMPMLAGVQLVAGEARDAVLGDPNRRKETDGDKGMKAVSRAGLLGVFDPLFNVVTGTRYNRDIATSLVGPAFGNLANAVQAGIELNTRNSDNTNTAERKVAKALYDIGIEPALNLLLTAAPAGSVLAPLLTQAAGSGQAREAFVSSVAGKQRNAKGGERRYALPPSN